jgi:hypothetical protein
MIDKLITLLGKSIESEEIKALFADWNAQYPKVITCTADNPSLKGKVERDCVRLYFGKGGNSRYLKPIPAKWEGGYIGQFTLIEFTKKRKGGIPFDVEFSMTAEELTAILGKSVTTEFVGTSTVWRKNYTKKHELIVTDNVFPDGTTLRSMTLGYIYEVEE